MRPPEWIGGLLAWVGIVLLTLLIGTGVQWLLFSRTAGPIGAYVFRWPMLWAIYFWVAIALVEQVTRRIASRPR